MCSIIGLEWGDIDAAGKPRWFPAKVVGKGDPKYPGTWHVKYTDEEHDEERQLERNAQDQFLENMATWHCDCSG